MFLKECLLLMSADTHVWLKLFNLTPGTGGTSVFHCAPCQETPLYYGMCVHVCACVCVSVCKVCGTKIVI